MRYWEDLPLDERAAEKERVRAELDALYAREFPFVADFGGESVAVLGPIERFPPYSEGPPAMRGQIMCESAARGRFITFATMLRVDGRRLVTPAPPWRDWKYPPLFPERTRDNPIARKTLKRSSLATPETQTKHRSCYGAKTGAFRFQVDRPDDRPTPTRSPEFRVYRVGSIYSFDDLPWLAQSDAVEQQGGDEVEETRGAWVDVEAAEARAREWSYRLALIGVDHLLDYLLKEHGFDSSAEGHIVRSGAVAELARSIRERGLDSPPVGTEGIHRVAAYKRLGRKRIPYFEII